MSRPAVLVVDRRGRAVETAESIDDRYRTRTATTVDSAVDIADRCDAVLLDAETRAESDADVVTRLRHTESSPPIALLVRQDPAFPLFRSPFDDYVRRPLSRSDLLDTVERLLVRDECDRVLQTSFATAHRLATLETDCETGCPEYDDLSDRFRHQCTRLGDYLEDLESASYDVATRRRFGSEFDDSDWVSGIDDAEGVVTDGSEAVEADDPEEQATHDREETVSVVSDPERPGVATDDTVEFQRR